MAINETISGVVNNLTYESAIKITQDPKIITALIIVWFIPIMIYLILGVTIKGKSASGHVSSKSMICFPNFWFAILVFGLIQLSLLLLVVFPVWLRIFE